MSGRAKVTEADRAAARVLWDYHRLGHRPRPVDAAIVLGCHDLGVATTAAELYHRGLVPVLVCSGAHNPVHGHLFPHGEAAAFAERLTALGVPASAVLREPRATNTGENIRLSRRVLDAAGIRVRSLMLVCMPYMQRRACSTCRVGWPDVEVVCASTEASMGDYVASLGDEHLVFDHMVGDLQRIMVYPRLGYAVAQQIPAPVRAAYDQLVAAGYTGRMLR